MELADHEVLEALRKQWLDRDVISTTWRGLVAHVIGAGVDPQSTALRLELEQVERELWSLTAAIAQTGGSDTLVRQIKKREEAAWVIRLRAAAPEGSMMAGASTTEVLARVHSAFADWREMLRAHAPEARLRLRQLTQGRITFMPKVDTSSRRYDFDGTGTVEPVLAGNVPRNLASPTSINQAGPSSLVASRRCFVQGGRLEGLFRRAA